MSKHLIMFDVDGTLVRSLDLEDKLLPRSYEQALGLDYVSSNWEEYEVPSDRGVVSELVVRHFNLAPTELEFGKSEACFFDLLKREFETFPECCRPVPGAIALFERLQSRPDTILAIATAGWNATARLKLSYAGFEIGDTILCSASDRATKEEIMKLATERVKSRHGTIAFDSITYIGDSPEDLEASIRLGYRFIGIRSRDSNDPEKYPHLDYSDLEPFLKSLYSFQK